MTKQIKSLSLIALVGALFISIGITLSSHAPFTSADAVCAHEGNHYTAKNATKTASGIKEYWVCCKCHEHFLEQISGTWNDAGTASITIDSNDNRYIPKTNEYDAQGLKYSADGKSITGFNKYSGVKEIVIPEGVTSVGTVFAGSNITSVVIPSTVSEIEGGAFRGCDSLTSVTITEGVEKLESTGTWPTMHGAFQDCSALKQIIIPSSVTEMDAYEFASANDNLKIYCVVSSKPSGWSSNWNKKHQLTSGTFTTYWGLGKGWHYASDGVTPIAN